MDIISFGPDREPGRWRPGGWPPRAWPRRRAWLVVSAVACVTVAAAVLLTSGRHTRQVLRMPAVAAQPMPPMLAGIPARAVHTDLFLAGDNFWRVIRQPRAILTGLLADGVSPLLPHDHTADVDQLVPVSGGVVALISDTSASIRYGALGPVVFIPASNAPARVIARAVVIAASPDGQQVWVQTAVQPVNHGAGAPAGFRSPTWAVDLAGRRVSPVLRLPLGLFWATDSGLLTQNPALRLWDGATGRPRHLPLPADVAYVGPGDDRMVWESFGPHSMLHVTDLGSGADVALALPGNWGPLGDAQFDSSGRRLVLPLGRGAASGNATAEALFVADTATRTLRMIPGTQLPVPAASSGQPDQLTGSWDDNGLLWVLATSPYGYYQLGFWTGAGPLRTFPPVKGSPVELSAPGPS